MKHRLIGIITLMLVLTMLLVLPLVTQAEGGPCNHPYTRKETVYPTCTEVQVAALPATVVGECPNAGYVFSFWIAPHLLHFWRSYPAAVHVASLCSFCQL